MQSSTLQMISCSRFTEEKDCLLGRNSGRFLRVSDVLFLLTKTSSGTQTESTSQRMMLEKTFKKDKEMRKNKHSKQLLKVLPLQKVEPKEKRKKARRKREETIRKLVKLIRRNDTYT